MAVNRRVLCVIAIAIVSAAVSLNAEQPAPQWNGPSLREDERPFLLGLQATAPWTARARALQIRAAAGAALLRVEANGSAADAQLRAGDLIVRFGEYDVENVEDLIAAASLAPRGKPQIVAFVRNNRRWQTSFTVVERGDGPPLAWFVHPSGAYRVRIPPAWQMAPLPEEKNLTILYDVLESAERQYQFEFDRRVAPVESNVTALADFKRREAALRPESVAFDAQVGEVPAACVGWRDRGEAIRTRYLVAFVCGRKLYRIEIAATALSLTDAWPLPVKHLLGTLQTAAAVEPMPPPIVDGREVVAGDLRLHLPTTWQDGPPLRAGEALWRSGDENAPEASLAVLRNQLVEPLLARVSAPRQSETVVLGRLAAVYEGDAVGTTQSARLRIVVVPAAAVGEDDLIFVCYARREHWDHYSTQFEQILQGVEVQPNDEVPP